MNKTGTNNAQKIEDLRCQVRKFNGDCKGKVKSKDVEQLLKKVEVIREEQNSSAGE